VEEEEEAEDCDVKVVVDTFLGNNVGKGA